jgi:hypothetical protein
VVTNQGKTSAVFFFANSHCDPQEEEIFLMFEDAVNIEINSTIFY